MPLLQAFRHRPVAVVVQQHAEESANLRQTHAVLVVAPHVQLYHLRGLDDRIAAHLDGLAVAAELGWEFCEAFLQKPDAGEVFAAMVRAIEERNMAGLDKVLALAEAAPGLRRGLLSAFGWVSPELLKGTIRKLLGSPVAFHRLMGVAACGAQRVDPGAALASSIADEEVMLRARGLRIAGELGRQDLLATCIEALADKDEACRLWAASSAVLLGDRRKAMNALEQAAMHPGACRERALRLVLKVLDVPQGNALLKALARDPANARVLIKGVGSLGDVFYMPWLIQQMADLKLARLAGESFSLITGLDLAYLDLEVKPPENFEPGPNDDPNDADVAMDEDESLPWPDAAKIQAWWSANAQRFTPGKRYFMGEEPSWEHCLKVLKDGYQRQRIAAAEWRCILRPGTVLFNTAAPAWRQEEELKRLEALG